MSSIRRFLSRLGILSERRATGIRVPIHVGARLDLDVVSLDGTARDLSAGGLFFETKVPLAPGLRGAVVRDGSRDLVPVRVTWWRPARDGAPGGVGLQFE